MKGDDDGERDRSRKQKKPRPTCPICDKVFSSTKNRDRHQLIHVAAAEKTILKCDQCAATFSQQRYLNQHKQKFHESRVRVTCDVCGDKLPRSLLNSHRLESHPEDFYWSSRNRVERRSFTSRRSICIFCNKQPFTIMARLHRHILSEIRERPFICRICGTEFLRKDHLKRHRDKFKGQCEELEEEQEKTSSNKNDTKTLIKIKKLEAKLAKMTKEVESQGLDQRHQKSGQSMSFLCSICDTSFRNKLELNEHKKSHFEATTDLDLDHSDIDLDHNTDPDKKKKKNRHKKIKFQCAFCPARFGAMEWLEKHFTELHKGNVGLDDDEDENLENEGALKST